VVGNNQQTSTPLGHAKVGCVHCGGINTVTEPLDGTAKRTEDRSAPRSGAPHARDIFDDDIARPQIPGPGNDGLIEMVARIFGDLVLQMGPRTVSRLAEPLAWKPGCQDMNSARQHVMSPALDESPELCHPDLF